MKRSAFLAHFALWVAICLVSTAFLAWYNLSGAADAKSADATAVLQLGVALAAPVLLYGIGAVGGLLLVRLKDIRMGHAGRAACRVVAAAALLFIVAAGAAILLPHPAGEYPTAAIVLAYLSMAAPLLIMVFGVVYAFGCAPLDSSHSNG